MQCKQRKIIMIQGWTKKNRLICLLAHDVSRHTWAPKWSCENFFCPAPTDEMKQWNLSRIRSIAYKAAASPRILVLDIYLFHRHVGLLFAAEVKGLSWIGIVLLCFCYLSMLDVYFVTVRPSPQSVQLYLDGEWLSTPHLSYKRSSKYFTALLPKKIIKCLDGERRCPT